MSKDGSNVSDVPRYITSSETANNDGGARYAEKSETITNNTKTDKPDEKDHDDGQDLEIEFDTQGFLDFETEFNNITTCWNTILAVSAVLDFFAATVDSDMRKFLDVEMHRFDPWLRRHAFVLGMIFSFLWFFDAFVTATQVRNKALQEAEKAALLREKGWKKNVWLARRRARFGYFRSVVLQLILLPVGFYIWLTRTESFTLNVYFVQEHDDRAFNDSDEDGTETFTRTANVSLLYAISHACLHSLSKALRTNFARYTKRSILRLLGRQLRHPVKFVRTVSRVTRWLRWVRVVGPVIGTTNKLLGNTVDLMKKIKQRRDAARAAEIRRNLWYKMSEEEVRNYAATLVQKIYRAKKSRREFRALQLLQGDKERIAALKLQRSFRAASRRAKRKLEWKKMELQRLEGQKMKDLTKTEKIRMFKLRAYLAKEAGEFVNENLLRPNTTFSVVWRTAFVLAVVLELSLLLVRIQSPKFTKASLVPVPFSELKECRHSEGGRFAKFRKVFSRKIPQPRPWYCDDEIVTLHAFGLNIWKLVIETIVLLVDLLFFGDVLVSFFTGQWNPNNGVLEPKPFFVRWIAPGALLQLLVNPAMDSVAEFLGDTFSKIYALGIVRVFRWTVAIFFPLFRVTTRWLAESWTRFVAKQNSTVRH